MQNSSKTEKREISKTDRIAGDEARNPIGDLEGVRGTGPDDLNLVDIELRLVPLIGQVINAVHSLFSDIQIREN